MKHHLTATAAVLAVLVGGTLIAQGGGGPRPRLGEDRVLFGKDSYQIDEFPDYWRVFETEDEYFDYYRDLLPGSPRSRRTPSNTDISRVGLPSMARM